MSYKDLVVDRLLMLENGEALSINTEEDDFSLAREIAIAAAEKTAVPVKIVVTKNGRPADVIEIEPEGTFAQVRRYALLRIKPLNTDVLPDEALDIAVLADDFPVLQHYGHLSEPLSPNRRIALPWCVVPADTEMLESIDVDKAIIADYRRKYLNSLNPSLLEFKSDSTDFSLIIPQEARFTGGTTVLSSGRRFLSSVDFDRLVCPVDCNSAHGKLTGTVNVLGRVHEAEFVFNEGNLVSVNPDRHFKKLSEFDKLLEKPGYISMRDKEFFVYLGGSLTDGLEGDYENEDDLPQYLNRSVYSLRIRLEDRINVFCTGRDLKKTELVRKGFFLE